MSSRFMAGRSAFELTFRDSGEGLTPGDFRPAS